MFPIEACAGSERVGDAGQEWVEDGEAGADDHVRAVAGCWRRRRRGRDQRDVGLGARRKHQREDDEEAAEPDRGLLDASPAIVRHGRVPRSAGVGRASSAQVDVVRNKRNDPRATARPPDWAIRRRGPSEGVGRPKAWAVRRRGPSEGVGARRRSFRLTGTKPTFANHRSADPGPDRWHGFASAGKVGRGRDPRATRGRKPGRCPPGRHAAGARSVARRVPWTQALHTHSSRAAAGHLPGPTAALSRPPGTGCAAGTGGAPGRRYVSGGGSRRGGRGRTSFAISGSPSAARDHEQWRAVPALGRRVVERLRVPAVAAGRHVLGCGSGDPRGVRRRDGHDRRRLPRLDPLRPAFDGPARRHEGERDQEHERQRRPEDDPLLARRPEPGDRPPDLRRRLRRRVVVASADRDDRRVDAGHVGREHPDLLHEVEGLLERRTRRRHVAGRGELPAREVSGGSQLRDGGRPLPRRGRHPAPRVDPRQRRVGLAGHVPRPRRRRDRRRCGVELPRGQRRPDRHRDGPVGRGRQERPVRPPRLGPPGEHGGIGRDPVLDEEVGRQAVGRPRGVQRELVDRVQPVLHVAAFDARVPDPPPSTAYGSRRASSAMIAVVIRSSPAASATAADHVARGEVLRHGRVVLRRRRRRGDRCPVREVDRPAPRRRGPRTAPRPRRIDPAHSAKPSASHGSAKVERLNHACASSCWTSAGSPKSSPTVIALAAPSNVPERPDAVPASRMSIGPVAAGATPVSRSSIGRLEVTSARTPSAQAWSSGHERRRIVVPPGPGRRSVRYAPALRAAEAGLPAGGRGDRAAREDPVVAARPMP